MSILRKLLKRGPPNSAASAHDPSESTDAAAASDVYRIVVAQYTRLGYNVGQEEDFHWALVLLRPNKSAGYAYQVTNDVVSLGDGVGKVIWKHQHQDIDLDKSSKCKGGVVIGTLHESDMAEFNKARTSSSTQFTD